MTFIINDYLIKLYINDEFIYIECIDNKLNKYSNKFNNDDIKLTFNLKNIYKIICNKLENKDIIITNNDDYLKIYFIIDKIYEFNFDIILYQDISNKIEKQNELIIKLQDENKKLLNKIDNTQLCIATGNSYDIIDHYGIKIFNKNVYTNICVKNIIIKFDDGNYETDDILKRYEKKISLIHCFDDENGIYYDELEGYNLDFEYKNFELLYKLEKLEIYNLDTNIHFTHKKYDLDKYESNIIRKNINIKTLKKYSKEHNFKYYKNKYR